VASGSTLSIKRLETIFLRAARIQRLGALGRVAGLEGLALKVARSALRRFLVRLRGGIAPIAISLSPTQRCNLACAGCYARDYPRDDELPLETIDQVLRAAERQGVFLVVLTGGEPLLREGLVEVLSAHRRLLFLLVTNGTLVDPRLAAEIARARNIVPAVSLEGPEDVTDARRGAGAYRAALGAMAHLAAEGVLFGFSATVTRQTCEVVVSDGFVAAMIERGCALGFYTEYVPVGSDARGDWVLDQDQRRLLRSRLLDIRRKQSLLAVHLPDDEYDRRGRCMAVVGGSVHINAQGFVEPCPFAHFAADNVQDKPLGEILASPFLGRLRSSEAVIRTGPIGCALVENKGMVEVIARETGAKPTECPPGLEEDRG
jgi:MoaA/NifB/PqqE/SkfB family radical SAM enzyme